MNDKEITERLTGKLESIQRYLKTGEIGSFLSMDATLAMAHAEHGWKGIIPAYAEFSQQWIQVYRRVNTALEEISAKAKEFEFKHWMGFCNEDVEELLRLRHQWNNFDWKHATEKEGDAIRDLWDPHPVSGDFSDESYWRKSWQGYIDRRDGEPLQKTFDGSGCSAELPKMKIMMLSSAGRVLLTLQDRFAQNHPESIYGGAWVSLIFDESSGYPRGGVQGQCATRDEAVSLIQAVIDDMPLLTSDEGIRIG